MSHCDTADRYGAFMVESSPIAGPLKVLALSSLFPNDAQPAHGIFLSHRLDHLATREGLALRVLAPVPWFPFDHPLFGRYSVYARVPARQERRLFQVLHPRYCVIPKVSAAWAPLLMAASLAPTLAQLRLQDFAFDVIDAYYLYPDGVAAALLGALFSVPVVLTALGSDVSLLPRSTVPRMQIKWAMRRAQGVTAVCQALLDEMHALGVPPGRGRVVFHGVDLTLFKPPPDRESMRQALGMSGPTLLSVGSLIPRKGHDVAISALQFLPMCKLIIVGAGPMYSSLRNQAVTLGVADRVTFLGEVDQQRLSAIMGAADALVLCSEREGLANVLMESLACGTPVIATPIWGTPEIVTVPAAGILTLDRSPEAVAAAVTEFLANPPDRAAARKYVEQFSWNRTADEHFRVLQEAVETARRSCICNDRTG